MSYFRYTPSSLHTMFTQFSGVTITPRGTDVSVIASKLVVLWVRNLLPERRWRLFFVPAWVLASPISAVALVIAYVCTVASIGSSTIPSDTQSWFRSSAKDLEMRTVQDEDGYNQGWAGGTALRVRTERRRDLIISRMDPAPSRTVLEIGCGRGELARSLAAKTRMDVLGVDVSESFVQEARATAPESNLHFDVLDFTQPSDMSGRQFDYIVGNGILHHLYYNLPTALLSMRGLLAPNGRVIFLEPNLHNPYVYLIFTCDKLRHLARLEPDEMAFSKRYAIAALRDADFRDVRVDYRDFLVPGVPIGSSSQS